MKKSAILMTLVLLALFGTLCGARNAAALDAPHNTTSGTPWTIACNSCHFTPTSIPSWFTLPTTTDNTRFNNLCTSCHSAGNLTTSKYEDIQTHSAQSTSSSYWSGKWTVECRVCHSPHNQTQQTSFGADALNTIHTGTVASLASSATATMSTLVATAGTFTTDYYLGYQLIPNTAYPTKMYRIIANNATSFTVAGAINLNYAAAGKPYSVRYGKMVNSLIKYQYPAYVNATVKLYKNSGEYSFASSTNTATSVCMVCHTQTHSYTRAGLLNDPAKHSDDPGQLPGGKCTDCHEHKYGFKAPEAGCFDCHGNPPIVNTTGPTGVVGFGPNNTSYDVTGATSPVSAGAHSRHSSTTALGMLCKTCHSNSTMPTVDLKIGLGFAANTTNVAGWGGTSVITGTISVYSTLSNTYTWLAASGTDLVSSSSRSYTCSTVYCHGGGSSGAGVLPLSGGTITKPTWVDANQAVCGSCHGATSSTYITAGSHSRHAGTGTGRLNIPCADCHGAVSSGSHVNGSVAWSLNTSNPSFSTSAQYRGAPSGATGGLAPSASYGTCSGVKCHSSGQADDGTFSPLTYGTVTWGGTLNCGSCHKNMDSDSSAPGNHKKHAQDASISCGACHNLYSEISATPSTHTDGNVNLSFVSGIAPTTVYSQGSGSLGNGYGNCSTSYCHSTVQSNTGGTAIATYRTITWGQTGPLDCGACHVNMFSDAAPPSSHGRHAKSAAISCDVCHDGYTNASAPSTHVTQTIDVVFNAGKAGAGTLYTGGSVSGNHKAGGGYGSCYTSYCHSTVQGASGTGAPTYQTVTLGTTGLTCGSCHKNMLTDMTSPGSHVKHAKTYGFGCGVCHGSGYTATQTDTTIHVNKLIETSYTGTAAGTIYTGGSPTSGNHAPGGGYGNCSASYCHSAAQSATGGPVPATYATVSWGVTGLTCGSCHKDMSVDTAGPGSHPSHAVTAGYACSVCHSGYTSTSVTVATHVDGMINTGFTSTGLNTIYSQGNSSAAGNGYGTCSATACHGGATPTWGANTDYNTCTKCHGTGTTGAVTASNRYVTAPPANAAGLSGTPTGTGQVSNDPKVGAHQTHLRLFNGLTGTNVADADLRCQYCHGTLPVTGNHANGSSAPTFTGLATNYGARIPTYANGTCSNTYCHNPAGTGGTLNAANVGVATAPSWTNAGYLADGTLKTTTNCNRCHLVPDDAGFTSTQDHSAYKIGLGTNCGTCHDHDGANSALTHRHMDGVKWAGGCTNCHGNPPSTSSIGGGALNGLASPATGATNPASPGAHVAHSVTKGMMCDACHKNSDMPSTTEHKINMGFYIDGSTFPGFSGTVTGGTFTGRTTSSLTNAYTWSTSLPGMIIGEDSTTYNTCAVYCHGTTNSTSWTASGPLACNQCHQATNSATGLSARHLPHYNSATTATVLAGGADAHTSTAYVYACLNCHPTTQHIQGPVNSAQTASVGGTKITVYSAVGPTTKDSQGFVYSQNSTCTTVCHSRDGAGGTASTTVTWGTATTSPNCGVCHRASGENYATMTSSPTKLSNAHAVHMATDRYSANANFSCNTCHSGTAATNSTLTTTGRNQHPNAAKDVAFNAWAGSGGGASCTTSYCHSNGTAFAGAYSHTSIAWSAANPGCGGCHNNPPSGYANKANAHAKHGTYTCDICHSTVVNSTPAIIGYSLHVNKAYDVVSASIGTYIPEGTPSTTGGTCNTISCHGGNNAAWGATLACQDCHGNSGASGTEVEDYGTGTAASMFSSNGSTTVANINTIDWNAVGHGKDTGSYTSTNPAANLLQYWAGGNKCLFCHDSTVSHATSTNPFRLRNVATVNKVCMDCHASSGATGVQPTGATQPKLATRLVGTNHYNLGTASNARHNTTDLSGGRFCWDCHDPHGTAGNTYMIGVGPNKRAARRIDTTSFDLGIPFGGTNSAGTTTAFGRTNPVTFTAIKSLEARTNYITEGAYDGGKICQTCHVSTSGIAQYANGLSTNGHNSPTLCTSCHKHDSTGFQGAGGDNCNSCHTTAGLSANHTLHSDVDGFLTGKKVSQSDYGRYTAGGGGIWWYSVTYSGGVPKYSCGYCHPQSSTTHQNGSKNLSFIYNEAGAAGTIKALNNTTQSFTQTPGVSVTCSSVYCHSNGFSPYTYKTTPNWFGGTFTGDRCDACHSNMPNRSGGTAGSPAHVMHERGIHYRDIYNGVNAQIAETGASGAGHGDPNTSTVINCYACHYGTVTEKYNAAGALCSTCHSDTNTPLTGNETMVTVSTGTVHVNGTPDIVFAPVNMKVRAQMRDILSVQELDENWTRTVAYKATATTGNDTSKKLLSAASFSTVAKSCSNVACHNQDAAGTRTIQWNTGLSVNPDLCYNCHRRLP